MNREKALIKNTLILAVGNFLPKLTTLITLPILTQYLSKTDYGTYDLISTIASLLIPIVTLKIDMGAFRFLIECRDDKKRAKEIISSAVFFVLPISMITMIFVYIIMIQRGINEILCLLICLYFFFDGIYSLIIQIVRGLAKNLLYSIGAISYAVTNMLLICVLVAGIQQGIYGIVISMLLSLIVTIGFLVYRIKLWELVSIRTLSKKALRDILEYSWPLIPNSLSAWVMNLSDRVVITTVLGLEINAVYAVANKIPHLFTIFQSTFVAAWQENASIAITDDDKELYYSTVFDTIFSLLIGIMAVLIAIAPILFKVLIRGSYQDAYYQMPFLFGGMICSGLASFIGGIYAAHKQTKSVGITTMIAAALNLIVNILLIKVIGLYAASISTFISYLLLVVFRMKDVLRFQKLYYNYKKIVFCSMILILMGIIAYINSQCLNVLNGCFGIIFAFILNYSVVMVLLKALVDKLSLVKKKG